uniref:Syntaxin-18 n=1 Tax=Clastoptera arizonana TaxID=38151 RepID=A0A1B6CVB8_9HEMI
MEITPLFKACVKTIRTRNKALGTIQLGSDNTDKRKPILFSSGKHSQNEFTHKAKDIVTQITRLKDFLLEHRSAYLNFSSNRLDLPEMSDIERDKIDSGAQRIMKTCSHLLLEFKREYALIENSPQLEEHQDSVFDLIENYLKNVCKVYSEQKAIRMKRTLDVQKMLKLHPEPIKDGMEKILKRRNTGESDKTSNSDLSMLETESTSLLQDETLTAEELQMFESENEQLYNELNSLSEEVRQIESKVVHIAELQEIFTEKVLDQEKDIERIIGTSIGTTENIKDANTQIRQAIQTNAGLRIYVLFFLLVMSLTLLFLDWYND